MPSKAQSSDGDVSKSTRPWWQNAVCYQIWPMSFCDSNSDGIGDIRGIISKLPYLHELGIDVIWVSPTYASPLADYGYDISDYQDICPKFGTLEDMDELIAEVHKLGMRILLDLVVTHTSDQHAWFRESRRSKDNAKSEWYIWKDGRKGHKIFNPLTNTYDEVAEPTNWRACFGGSAWTYVPERDQYYLNLFMSAEPDLNWELPHVRQAIYEEAVGFWLDKGIDGFRIDTSNRISKDWSWPDAPVKLEERIQPASEFYINGPRSHEFLQEMRAYMDNHPRVKERGESLMLVGELPRTDYDGVLKYVSPESKELSMVFDFDMVKLGGHDDPDEVKAHQVKNLCDRDPSFTLPLFMQGLQKVQDLIADGGWGTVFMENHDQCRSIDRYTTPDKAYRDRAAKLLCLLQTTLSGTQFVFQGQEIGMTNMPEYWDTDDFRDPAAINYVHSEQEKAEAKDRYAGYELGLEAREQARRGVIKFGRDNGRTPMQWSSGKHAGFSNTDGDTWIKVNHNYGLQESINVEDQQKDDHSIWNFWAQHIAMRKKYAEIFMHGEFTILDEGNEDMFMYTKTAADGRLAVVVLNFSETESPFPWNQSVGQEVRYLAGNICKSDVCGNVECRPRMAWWQPLRRWEGRVLLVESP